MRGNVTTSQLAVCGRGDNEYDSEMATTTNRAMESPQQCDSQPACKVQEEPANNRRLKRGGGDKRAG
jgi:hypothetical protein